jgi:hypothetical protein
MENYPKCHPVHINLSVGLNSEPQGAGIYHEKNGRGDSNKGAYKC